MDDRVFGVQSRVWGIATSLALLGIGALNIVGGALTIVAEGVHGGILFGLAFGAAFLAGGIASLHEVCAIKVGLDGTIEFRRVLGARRIAAREVRRLHGKVTWDDDGRCGWQLRVDSLHGHFTVKEFPGVGAVTRRWIAQRTGWE